MSATQITRKDIEQQMAIQFNNLIVYAERYRKPAYVESQQTLKDDIMRCVFKMSTLAETISEFDLEDMIKKGYEDLKND